MAQKTLVKNVFVRPLVTMPSNGHVRKLVTRCLSELIKTSVGNKLPAQIAGPLIGDRLGAPLGLGFLDLAFGRLR